MEIENDICDICGEDANNIFFYCIADPECPRNADAERGIELYLCNDCLKKYDKRDRDLIARVKATQQEIK